MMLYLTVEDGPSEHARDVLGYLAARKVGAVLFCCGAKLEARPDVAVEAIRSGFILGNHSFDHLDFNTLSPRDARAQISRTDEVIERLYRRAGALRPARYFRFPYGHSGRNKSARNANQAVLCELCYHAPLHRPNADWGWDVDFEDWDVTASNAPEKLKAALGKIRRLQPDSVLGLHDHELNFRTRLFQGILDAILADGHRFYDNSHLDYQAIG